MCAGMWVCLGFLSVQKQACLVSRKLYIICRCEYKWLFFSLWPCDKLASCLECHPARQKEGLQRASGIENSWSRRHFILMAYYIFNIFVLIGNNIMLQDAWNISISITGVKQLSKSNGIQIHLIFIYLISRELPRMMTLTRFSARHRASQLFPASGVLSHLAKED